MTNRGVRAYCFTLNNYTDDDKAQIQAFIDKNRVKYCIYGHEKCPTTGTPHLQGYIYLRDAMTMAALSKHIRRASWRQANGNSDQNEKYCTKDATDIFEYGTKPMDQKRKGEAEKERWDNARKMAKTGDFDSIDSDIYIKYIGNLKKIYADARPKVQSLDTTTGVWIYGDTGTGKTTYVNSTYGESLYVKNANKWFTGYKDEKYVLLDDLDPETAKHLARYVKLWGDHHPFAAETKGSEIFIRPEKFIITSNHTIEDCFSHLPEVDIDAIKRRYHVIHKTMLPLTD